MRRFRVRPSAIAGVLGKVWRHPSNVDARGSAIAKMLKFHIQGRLFGRSTIVPVGSTSRLIAYPDDVGSRRAVTARLPDFAEMTTWISELQSDSLFIDVGANVGMYSTIAAEAGADVIALEPLPSAREQLRANLELNGYSADVRSEAVGASIGVLYLDGIDPQRMHLQNSGTNGAEEVAVTTLDEVLGDRIAHGVKVDVEGAERQVLEGAGRALSEQRIRLIQLEWNETSMTNFGESRAPVAALLADAGYELLRPDDSGTLHRISDPSYGPDVFARPRRNAADPEAS